MGKRHLWRHATLPLTAAFAPRSFTTGPPPPVTRVLVFSLHVIFIDVRKGVGQQPGPTGLPPHAMTVKALSLSLDGALLTHAKVHLPEIPPCGCIAQERRQGVARGVVKLCHEALHRIRFTP